MPRRSIFSQGAVALHYAAQVGAFDVTRSMSMLEHVRIGVVGTSWWAELMYLPVLKRHPRAELVAVCGRNRERVDQIAQKYSLSHAFTDYQEMIEQAGLHALVVSTPDDLHYPITMAALDAGLHVLCEKPLALDMAQARAMYEKAEAAGVTHMVLFTYRWLPPYRYVRQLVDEGYLGRPFNCSMRYVCGFGRDPQDRWRLDPQRARGVLGDIGSHMIDLARWYLGDVAGVGAHLTAFVGRIDSQGRRIDSTNDSAALTLLFQNGAQATIQLIRHLAARRSMARGRMNGNLRAFSRSTTGRQRRIRMSMR
jgi:predicted dehydrogenase